MIFVIALVLTTLIVVPLLLINNRVKKGKKSKTPLIANICSFFGILLFSAIFCLGQSALAADAVETAETASSLADGLKYIGAALAVGLSGIGGGIAVASAASAALGAISENDGAFGKSLIFVGLAEGVALYGLIVALLLVFM